MKRYFKLVHPNNEELFEKLKPFLEKEITLYCKQRYEIEIAIPEFTHYSLRTTFCRVPVYRSFVFKEEPEAKVWIKDCVKDGLQYYKPNKLSAAGREMLEYLNKFERTTMWNLYDILNMEALYGADFYMPDCFILDSIIYLSFDNKHVDELMEKHKGFEEIHYGEMNTYFWSWQNMREERYKEYKQEREKQHEEV